MRTLRTIALVLLILSVLGMVAAALLVSHGHRDRIFPGVEVVPTAAILDPADVEPAIQVGDLDRQAARARVSTALRPLEERVLVIQLDGVQVWTLSWAEAGQSYAIDDAVERALAVGRELPWALGFLRVLRPEPARITLDIVPADPALVRAIADRIVVELAAPPQDAALAIVNGSVEATPAQPGRRLEPDRITTQLLDALSTGASAVELVSDPVAPQIATAEPALAQVTALLSEPFVLAVVDPLTGDLRRSDAPEVGGYRAEFAVNPQTLGQWLRLSPRKGALPRGEIHLNFDVLGVRAWVESLAPQVSDEERTLAVDATAVAVLEALRKSEHQAMARVYHPTRTYVVRAGDTFFDIAYAHGFPQWRLEQANPDIDPGLIDVGQVLIIPSIDVLFPHPLIPNKRIEIDLPTQTLRAFDADQQRFEFRISSGISTTPTLAGQFQILFKEEMAFAQRWHLDMPYFMGFYAEGEDFYNGIHELPITSYGTRLSPYVLGWPASYGCIIVNEGDAEALYQWAPVGTLVRVHGVAPGTPFGQQTLLDIAPLVEEPAP